MTADEPARSACTSGPIDRQAWSLLVERHLDALVDVATRLGLSGQPMEEAVELAWLRLAQRHPQLPSAVPVWLARSVAEVALRTTSTDWVVKLTAAAVTGPDANVLEGHFRDYH